MVVVMAAIKLVANQCTMPWRMLNSTMISWSATFTTVALNTVAMVPTITVQTANQRQLLPYRAVSPSTELSLKRLLLFFAVFHDSVEHLQGNRNIAFIHTLKHFIPQRVGAVAEDFHEVTA